MSSTKYSPDDANKIEQQSNQIFQYGNKIVNYTLIRSKRRKTSEIIVDKNSQIIIRVPFEKTISEIEQILNDKIKWAITKQKEYQNELRDIVKPTYENNSTLPYLGKNYDLQIRCLGNDNNNERDEKISFVDNEFIAYIFDIASQSHQHINKRTSQIEKVSRLYNDWLRSEANKLFKEKIDKYEKLIAVTPKDIVIKLLRNRWGSLTKQGNIHLNFNLIKAPEDVIDYIIVHELCHLKIKGHSYQFWDYLKQFVPDYSEKIKWLERNSTNLLT